MKLPTYAKFAFIIICMFGLVAALYIGQTILLPLVFAGIFAILLNPLVKFLSRRMHRVIAIAIAVLVMLLVMAGFVVLISTQVAMVVNTYPELKTKVETSSGEAINWVSTQLNLPQEDIEGWIKETESSAVNGAGPVIGQTLMGVGNTLFVLLLVPVYLFLILYYKTLLLEFIRRLFKEGDHDTVGTVLIKTKGIIQSYLVGLLLEMLVVATLNSVGLLLMGIDYAIIMGIMGAVLNLIPYVGNFIGTILPMTMAFLTKDSLVYPLAVMGQYIVVQFIDNNFIVPKVVASKVELNALVSILAVIVGGTVWGIPGMFLSIPLTAILKVTFDNIDSMKPWGFLLGNIVPTVSRFRFRRK